jgi:hypothetical protein
VTSNGLVIFKKFSTQIADSIGALMPSRPGTSRNSSVRVIDSRLC